MEWETSKNAKPLDEQVVIRKMISDRLNSAKIYEQASREDLAKIEFLEVEYLNEFKEKDVSELDIFNFIEQIINEDLSDIGLIMKAIKTRYPNCDMKISSQIAKKPLNK